MDRTLEVGDKIVQEDTIFQQIIQNLNIDPELSQRITNFTHAQLFTQQTDSSLVAANVPAIKIQTRRGTIGFVTLQDPDPDNNLIYQEMMDRFYLIFDATIGQVNRNERVIKIFDSVRNSVEAFEKTIQSLKATLSDQSTTSYHQKASADIQTLEAKKQKKILFLQQLLNHLSVAYAYGTKVFDSIQIWEGNIAIKKNMLPTTPNPVDKKTIEGDIEAMQHFIIHLRHNLYHIEALLHTLYPFVRNDMLSQLHSTARYLTGFSTQAAQLRHSITGVKDMADKIILAFDSHTDIGTIAYEEFLNQYRDTVATLLQPSLMREQTIAENRIQAIRIGDFQEHSDAP